MIKLASIDIGTNAIKLKIFESSQTKLSFIESERTPIRLGSDVFKKGFLSKDKLEELSNVLRDYQKILNKNNIDIYEIVATSAFRETDKSEESRRFVEKKINHPIRIISGLEEAKLISFHPKAQENCSKIFVDIGGGSTEFYSYVDNKHQIESFNLGGVRNMLKKDNKSEWILMKEWLSKHSDKKILVGIGGNIRSFFSVYKKSCMSRNEFIKKVDELSKLNQDEKQKKYKLNPDRVDIIDYALDIYKNIVTNTNIEKIKSIKWGVSDSIAVKLFHETYSKKIKISRD